MVARQLFNLPINKRIILLGAESITNKRKGYQLFLDSLQLLKLEESDNVICCTFGQNGDVEMKNTVIRHIGTISDERLLCMLYSASDLFIMPSIEEAFGQVTIEALSCGIPVVSFPNGGSLDIINDGINGFLAKDFTSQSLAQAIKTAMDFPFDRSVIRKDAEKRFNIEDKVDKYIQLYKEMLNA